MTYFNEGGWLGVLTSFGRFPGQVYPAAFQGLLTAVVPIGLIAWVPVAFVTAQPLSFWLAGSAVASLGGWFAVATFLWRRALTQSHD